MKHKKSGKRRTKIRCTCCNKLLSDYEATRKTVSHNEYLDVCNKCYYPSMANDIPCYTREDLNPVDDTPEEWEDNLDDECVEEEDNE